MILDGGLGVELAARGFAYTTRLWSGEAILARPDLLLDVHRAYLDAGADVLATATYQVSHAVLRELGYRDETAIDAVFARAVELARAAIGAHPSATGALRTVRVAASLGPYGATVGDGSEYGGVMHLEREALAAFHTERLRSIIRAGPDIIMFETIPTEIEAFVIAEVTGRLGLTDVWLSLSCASGERTFGGDAVRSIAAALDRCASIGVVGVNCTAPAAIEPLVRAIAANTGKPISICPNLGQVWETDSHELAGGSTEADFLAHVPAWLKLGVAHIGGCCGVGPSTVCALAAIARGFERSSTIAWRTREALGATELRY